jgi:hypothetical protein
MDVTMGSSHQGCPRQFQEQRERAQGPSASLKELQVQYYLVLRYVVLFAAVRVLIIRGSCIPASIVLNSLKRSIRRETNHDLT